MGHCMQDYKCLCTAVTICVTLFVPKFDLSILTPLTMKSRSSPRNWLQPFQLHPQSKFGDCRSASCRDNADISIFMMTKKTSEVGQGDLVFGFRSGCASRSAHTRSQVSVYSDYDLCHLGCPKMFVVHFDPSTP